MIRNLFLKTNTAKLLQTNLSSRLLFALIIFFQPTMVFSTSMEVCKLAAETINKMVPLRKDRFTVMRQAGCLAGKPKNKLIHILDIEVEAELAKEVDFKNGIKPDVLNTYCSDPQIRPTLDAFDIDFRYYAKKGVFVGSFLITSKECK